MIRKNPVCWQKTFENYLSLTKLQEHLILFNLKDIKNKIKMFNLKKVPGLDLITKEQPKKETVKLMYTFNTILRPENWPIPLKMSKITVISKSEKTAQTFHLIVQLVCCQKFQNFLKNLCSKELTMIFLSSTESLIISLNSEMSIQPISSTIA